MEQEKIKVGFKAYYAGHNIKSNGIITLKLKLSSESSISIIRLFQLIGKNFAMVIGLNSGNVKAGFFSIDNIKIDRDGESIVTLKTDVENVEVNSLNILLEEEEIFSFKVVEK